MCCGRDKAIRSPKSWFSFLFLGTHENYISQNPLQWWEAFAGVWSRKGKLTALRGFWVEAVKNQGAALPLTPSAVVTTEPHVPWG